MPTPDRSQLQRRTLGTLVVAQVFGGVGVASGIAVTALLARRLSGSDELAGFGTTAQVLGGALLTVPLARLMARRGRRPGLVLGYSIAIAGALLVILAAIAGSFPLMMAGTALFGGATASNSQSRYAAADLALPHRRGRDLSLVVWATTVGSVLGPNLIGPGEPVATALGLPALVGSYVFSILGFACALCFLAWRLRPDPLLIARQDEIADTPDAARDHVHGSIGHGLRVIASHPNAVLGLLTLAIGHAVMVSVMVMTPLQMDHGGASLRLIGLVISIHILGMYALSPVTGIAVDRVGGRPVALVGSVILVTATLLAARTDPGMSNGLAFALFLLGVGWSATLVSGSSLLTGAVPVHERPGVQGVSDLFMGLAGGGGGALAGVIIERWSFGALALGAAVISSLVGVAAVTARPGARRTLPA